MLEEKVEEKNKPQGKHSKLMPHKFDYWGDILEENKYAWRCHTCHALEFTKKDEIKIEKYDDIGEDGAPY
ncbi:hypothetical protein HYX16_06675, partial [Candidatus Woesearchaeota archaeon]|nr:hypothetical protein [Candidatus Woesearchaeota archaeon]